MQQPFTFLLRGGLNLVTPPISMSPGHLINALNYEPDVNGYTRTGGFERFDGQTAPSASEVPATIAAARSAITTVPGTGPVRGVAVYNGNVYAFRDKVAGGGGLYRNSSAGWTEVVFTCFLLNFDAGFFPLAQVNDAFVCD